MNWFGSLQALGSSALSKMMSGWWKLGIEKTFWSEDGTGRGQLLEAVLQNFPGSQDDETGKTDIIIRNGVFWNWAILTATEYHGDDKQLTRLRLLARPRLLTRIVALLVMLLIPAAITMGVLGEFNILIVLLAGYVAGEGLARLYMWMNRPRFSDVAKSIGLKMV
tara:strand:- start:1135 stop:1629 length:495 start_codon:yes stop_codon:yes gene_type:complete